MPNHQKKNLLIISCSQRKNKFRGEVKAWDLYDGVIYRLLKKNKIDFNKFEIKIISAKYGLITPSSKIKHYDQLMTPKRAIELKSSVAPKINRLINSNFHKIIFCLGKNYLSATGAPGLNRNSDIHKNIKIIKGGIGIKMKKLKQLILN